MNTRGKIDLQVRIHINEKLVQESSFGESPTWGRHLGQSFRV